MGKDLGEGKKKIDKEGDKKLNKEENLREIQRIKEQLGGAESKLKDAQLTRL